MCFAIPGQIKKTWPDKGTVFAEVDFAGVVRNVCLAFLPELEVGDWVIVQGGYAVSSVEPAQVDEVMASMQAADILE